MKMIYTTKLRASFCFVLICITPFEIFCQTVYQAVPGQVYVNQTAQFVYSGGCPSADITWRLEVNGNPDPNGTITPTGTNMGDALWTAPSTGTSVIAWCGSNPPETAATAPFDVINNPNNPPGAPVATAATNVTTNSFTANWQSVTNAAGYKLDVSESSTFSSFVNGYQDLAVSGTSANVTSLPSKQFFYYRLRATNSNGVSPNSNIIPVPVNDQNFVRIEETLVDGIKTESALNSASTNQKFTTTTFFDGLGRTMQTVQKQASPSFNDVVQPVVYDEFGRERFKYLPFTAGNDGWYRPNSSIIDPGTHSYIGVAQPFYAIGSNNGVADDSAPYSETIFEASPLNRVIKEGGTGAAWQPDNNYSYTSLDHTRKISYEGNNVNEVLWFKYIPPTTTYTLGHVVIGKYEYYPANRLYKNRSKDGDQNESIEFVDKNGRTILKKSQIDATNFAQTYSVYDDFGNLVTVLPPEATKKILVRLQSPSITWTTISGVTVGAASSLTKTASTGWSTGLAFSSVEYLKPGIDGWVEMVAEETNTSRMIGLAPSNKNYNAIDYALELRDNGRIYITENAVTIEDLGPYTTGTAVRVSREGNVIKYYVDGVFRRTSSTGSTGNLYVDAAIYHAGGTIKNPKTSFACDGVMQEALNNLAFRYTYDNRNRITQKVLPGSSVVYLVYDNSDRLVLTQDGNQRILNPKQWTFTKYDQHNRPVLTGIKDTSSLLTQAQMQSVVNAHYLKSWAKRAESFIGSASGNVHGYSNKSYPVVNFANAVDPHRFLTVTYYDNYSFKATLNDTTHYSFKQGELPGEQEPSYFKRLDGQVTGMKVKVLDGPISTNYPGYSWLNSVNYFDDNYRLIQTISSNIKSEFDVTTNVYDFTGKLLKTKTTHTQSDVSWKTLSGLTATGNRLSGAGSPVTGAGSAASNEMLSAGQDGWIEVEYPMFSGSIAAFGLSAIDEGTSPSTIDYCFKMTSNNISTMENNGFYGPTTVGKPGDRLKIERVGTAIKYYINESLFHTSFNPNPSTSSLLIDVYTESNVPVFLNIRASFAKSSQTVTKTFQYDHAGRLLNIWHKLNAGPDILLSSNSYNEIGQLIDKKLHSTQSNASDARQSLDLAYNIRGWFKSLNSASIGQDPANEPNDYFGFELGYNTSIGLDNPQFFNGNISAIKWSNGLGEAQIQQNGFVYAYDKLNRIKDATFKQASGDFPNLTWATATGNAFSESGISYDLNGNILALTRRGKDGGLLDALAYDYGTGASYSNRLIKVSDGGNDGEGFVEQFNSTDDDFTYDSNGNNLWDRNKGGTESLINGSFENGSANWSEYDPSNRLSFVNGSVEIVAGSSSASLQQLGCIKAGLPYAVVVNWERSASTNGLRVNVGGVQATLTSPGISTVTITAGTATDFIISPTSLNLAGKINSIEVKALTVNTYNHLNLPEKVSRGLDRWATFVYDATGRKLATEIYKSPNLLTKRTDYIGDFFYQNDTLKYISHDEGRVIMTGPTPEYQYNIKDIWNNTRLTFTTIPSQETFTATLESNTQGTETQYFQSYSRVDFDLFDHTDAGTVYTHSQLLNGGYSSQVGLAKSLSVMPGDTINVEVFAKYRNLTSTQGNLTGFASALTGAFGLTSTMTGDPAAAYDALDAYGSVIAGGFDHSDDVNAPKAYLNILLFDKDYNLVDAAYKQIGINNIQGNDALIKNPHGHLTRQVIVPVAGYAYIFLSNENPTQVDVYFDDLKIEHAKSPIIQTDDYYPFGLTFNSYRREGSFENKIKFQGQERITDLDLGWDAFKYRNYMPDIGRFFNVDPLSHQYTYNSPYAFAENKLGSGIELEGLERVSFMVARFEANQGHFQTPEQAARGINSERENTTFDKVNEFGAKEHIEFEVDLKTGEYSVTRAWDQTKNPFSKTIDMMKGDIFKLDYKLKIEVSKDGGFSISGTVDEFGFSINGNSTADQINTETQLTNLPEDDGGLIRMRGGPGEVTIGTKKATDCFFCGTENSAKQETSVKYNDEFRNQSGLSTIEPNDDEKGKESTFD